METKHTPGPWRYWQQKRTGGEDTCTFRNLAGAEVLRAVTHTLTEEDARLIAAAPELLQALRQLVASQYPVSKEIDPRGHAWCEAYLDQALPHALAAIAKATGAA